MPEFNPAPYSPPLHPLRAMLLPQLAGAAAVLLVVLLLVQGGGADFRSIPMLLALLQGGFAAIVALQMRAPLWWMPIHLVFAPLALLLLRFDIHPAWFLAAFFLLLLLFWRTDSNQAPLFLSNRATATALLSLLPNEPCSFIDLGCGDGGLLIRVARARPDCRCVGIEHAPLFWLLARWRTRRLPNVIVHCGDLWRHPLAAYDIVYAFLSPAPMARLWRKACEQMRPTALLVSNSFQAPGETAVRVLRVGDRSRTRLFCYRPHQNDNERESLAIPSIHSSSYHE